PGAHAADTCYEVLETSDNFLAMRWRPTTRSGIVWALRQGEGVITADPNVDTYARMQLKKFPTKNWVYAHTRELPHQDHQLEGWVYKKYLKEVSCEEETETPPGAIPGFPPPVPPKCTGKYDDCMKVLPMKKLFLAGIAALFVTSCQAPLRTAHAQQKS